MSTKFKFSRHLSRLSRHYCVNKEYQCNIYENKIRNVYEKRVCEFNHNLLNNFVCSYFLFLFVQNLNEENIQDETVVTFQMKIF